MKVWHGLSMTPHHYDNTIDEVDNMEIWWRQEWTTKKNTESTMYVENQGIVEYIFLNFYMNGKFT